MPTGIGPITGCRRAVQDCTEFMMTYLENQPKVGKGGVGQRILEELTRKIEWKGVKKSQPRVSDLLISILVC